MKTLARSRYALRWSVISLLLLLPGISAYARAHKSEAWARNQFSAAENTREALNKRPAEQRTRHEYQNAVNAYRRVYFGAPSSSKAAVSVAASAELMVEMGRRFHDDDALHSAIRQYEFLRREYPGSGARFEAMLAIGRIYKDDLNEVARGREVFEEFLRRYPHNHLVEQARAELSEPVQQAGLKSKDKDVGSSKENTKASTNKNSADDSVKGNPVSNDDGSAEDSAAPGSESDKTIHVTGVRHWSTPDYTRVSIDLDDGVKYESQRIDHPDRVFFDLLDTQLAGELLGKTFDVDDGLLKKIRVAQYQPGRSRIVLEVDAGSTYDAVLLSNPPRLFINIRNKQSPKTIVVKQETAAKSKPAALVVQSKPAPETASDSPAVKLRAESKKPVQLTSVSTPIKKTIVEADSDDDQTSAKLDASDSKIPASLQDAPDIDHPKVANSSSPKKSRKVATPEPPAREAQAFASGDRSLTRALGLKIGKIVIDPGHGGHDTGTIGPHGLEEKDLVLDVSRRLGKLLEARLGAEVVFTRKDDTFIPLESRTSIANQEEADLFVSVHANSSRDPDARGVETYYLNFTSSSEALDVAARENAASDKSIHELQDLVKKIALKEKIEESQEFASDVQQSLHSGLSTKNPGLRNRGVKKAPFIVLIGANMPSILAEISFVSNPGDEHRLRTPEYRQKIAESLYHGISKYVSGLSGVKVASKMDKGAGQ
ncbi:MAG TPA: N-acetylmuramoyl-L-alanine amidase [Terriglobales bacterium]|nr:N-acetylmuramoyl-L-alanine amidase [Terriglobales bacterium]